MKLAIVLKERITEKLEDLVTLADQFLEAPGQGKGQDKESAANGELKKVFSAKLGSGKNLETQSDATYAMSLDRSFVMWKPSRKATRNNLLLTWEMGDVCQSSAWL